MTSPHLENCQSTDDQSGTKAGTSHSNLSASSISTQAVEQGAQEISVGDHVVVRHSEWRVVTLKVSKVTEKQIKASGEWSSRDHTYRRDDVLFAGSKERAEELTAALDASYQQFTNEKSTALDRKVERDRAAISKATGASK